MQKSKFWEEVLIHFVNASPIISALELKFKDLSVFRDEKEGKPTESVIKHYIGGGSVRQANYLISCELKEHELDLIKGQNVFTKFCSWLESETHKGTLPNLYETSQEETSSSIGYVISMQGINDNFITEENGTIKYQIQFKLVYMLRA